MVNGGMIFLYAYFEDNYLWFITYLIDLQALSLTYIVTETDFGENVICNVNGSLLTFIGECNEAYQIQVESKTHLIVVATIGEL